jgi:putative flippase GtrA
MTNVARFARFNIVGVAGIGVQLACVAVLVHGLGVGAVTATAAGVAAAIVHNFAWHVRWTWRDRMGPGASRLAAFARFVGANGVVSLVGSVLLMPVLIGPAGLPAIPANLVTIAACGILNYWIGGRVCFPQIGPVGGQASRS